MKHRFIRTGVSMLFLLSCCVAPLAAAAEAAIPIDAEISMTSKQDTALDKDTTELTVDLMYTGKRPSSAEGKETNTIQLMLPSGLTYEGMDPAVTSQSTDRLMIDATKISKILPLTFSIQWSQLAEKSSIYGEHQVNGSTVGTLKELTIEKKETVVETTDSSSQKAAAVSQDESSLQTSSQQETSTTTTDKVPTIEYKRKPAKRNLSLDDPTARSLPVTNIVKKQYTNVSYFDVASRDEWEAALTKKNNNKEEITYLNITGDFSLSDDTGGSKMHANLLHTSVKNKKLIINGNGRTIDFRGETHWLMDVDWDVVIQNLTMYNSNEWGAFEGYNSGKEPVVTFYNVHQYGAQAFEGSHGKVILGGNSSFSSAASNQYVSPIDQQSVALDTRYSSGVNRGSANFSAGEVYVKAGADLTVENGGLGSNFTIFPKGNFYVEDGGKTVIRLNNPLAVSGNDWHGADYCPAAISIVSDIPLSAASWSEADRPASLMHRSNSVYLGTNTQLSITNGAGRSSHAGAIDIQNDKGSIELGKQAQLSVAIAKDSERDNEGETPIAFRKTGTMILNEQAAVDVSVGESSDIEQGQGAAVVFEDTGHLRLGNAASFKVSSSTSTNQGLLHFDKKGSSIELADQAVFDVGYTKKSDAPLVQMADGTVTMPVHGSYVHTVKAWHANNFDENKPDQLFQPLDHTNLQLNEKGISQIQTQAARGYQDQGTVKDFIAHFTMKQQRIVIQPLGYMVTLDRLTNIPANTNVVTGTAMPAGGTIQLTGGAFDLLSDKQRTVSIQSDGSYRWTGTLPQPLNAGDKITAVYAGNGKTAETIVADETKPEAKATTYHLVEGDTIPAAAAFITSVKDTYPTDTNHRHFAYQFTDHKIVADAKATITNGTDQQEYTGHVQVEDKAGNQTKPIPVHLIVHKQGTIGIISAKNQQIKASTVSRFATDDKGYQAFILKQTESAAYTIKAGKLVPLAISIQNISAIKTTVGSYTVQFVIKKTSRNGLQQDIHGQCSWKIISNLVNPTNPSEPSGGGEENNGTGAASDLRLDYVPSDFSFGEVDALATPQTVNAVGLNGDTRQWLQVSDNRSTANGWTVKARMTAFHGTQATSDVLQGATLSLPKGSTYNAETANQKNPAALGSQGVCTLSQDDQSIFYGNGSHAKKESTYVWHKTAVSLRVPGGQGKANEEYQSTITWTIESGVTR